MRIEFILEGEGKNYSPPITDCFLVISCKPNADFLLRFSLLSQMISKVYVEKSW